MFTLQFLYIYRHLISEIKSATWLICMQNLNLFFLFHMDPILVGKFVKIRHAYKLWDGGKK